MWSFKWERESLQFGDKWINISLEVQEKYEENITFFSTTQSFVWIVNKNNGCRLCELSKATMCEESYNETFETRDNCTSLAPSDFRLGPKLLQDADDAPYIHPRLPIHGSGPLPNVGHELELIQMATNTIWICNHLAPLCVLPISYKKWV